MAGVEMLALVSRTLPGFRGKLGVAARLRRRAEQREALDGAWRVRLRDGTRVELPRQSAMSWAAAFTGGWDAAVVSYLERFIAPDTIVLDIGASIGLWTVQLAKAAAARGAEVWAFEPNPANTPWITRNVTLNALEDYTTVREVGLGDEAASLTLVAADYGVGNGAIALADKPGTDKFPRITVTIERLDDIDLPRPVSFIKIDTEGYEAAFLRGASQTIQRDRPVIFGEFSSVWLERRGEDVRAPLAALGYDISALRVLRSRPWMAPDKVQTCPVDLDAGEPIPSNLLLRPSSPPAR
jgi:FkbM family methyltransferase